MIFPLSGRDGREVRIVLLGKLEVTPAGILIPAALALPVRSARRLFL